MLQDPYNYEPLDPDYKGPPVVGIKENQEEGLPAVLFRCSNTEVSVQAGVSNTNYNENARCVYVTTDSRPTVYLKQRKALRAINLNVSVLSDSALEDIVSDIEKDVF